MLILNEDNNPVDLNLIPDQVDMYFWVFDNATGAKDYFCVPLIMLESFYSPTIKLRLTIDNSRRNPTSYFINVPADYQILIGESSVSSLEVNPVTSLSGRKFKAFSLNPMASFMPTYLDIEVEDVLPSIKWFMPKVKTGQILAIPIENCYEPNCIYIVRDIPKSLESVHSSDLF
jgi:hypothetical protein